ncbi:TPA: hypothetical protein JRS43_001763 [Escherichia coli]|nr:hypothetical protein [Escherichia coli]HAY3964882.1 hypothetical protein [Escherichia coli]
MESNIKGLVSAGHEMASELKAECGAVDMRSVAKLISDLATQLEVQLVRANALAAENAALKQSEKEFNNFCRQEYYGWEDNFTAPPAPVSSEGLVKAVRFYEQVKRENPPVETGAWKDAVDWVLKEACQAVNIGTKGD